MKNAEAYLKIVVPSLPAKLDHQNIQSFTDYVIFDDILRPIISYNKSGELQAELVKSWKISEDDKKFTFEFKENQKDSSGNLITIDDLINSLKSLNEKIIIHGGTQNIKNISKISNTSFEISLSLSDPFFLHSLISPEYRIFTNNNYNISTGAYYIKSNSLNHIELQANPYSPKHDHTKYKNVRYANYNASDLNNDNFLKDVDIIWPNSGFDQSILDRLVKNGFKIHNFNIGFTYWLNLNPKTLTKKERIQLENYIKIKLENSKLYESQLLKKADQLFLNYGPGRLTNNEIELIKKQKYIDPNQSFLAKSINILLPVAIIDDVKNILIQNFKNSTITYYKDYNEYSKLISNKEFDLSFVNNDLSSTDLRESLNVTFNKNRPLIYTDKHTTIHDTISLMNNEKISLKRYEYVKKIGEEVLKESLIIPLYYKTGYLLYKGHLDFKNLEETGTETHIWKIL